MKRIAAILLTLALCLCPLAAFAEEEKTLTPEECEVLDHLIYEANTLDALFSRHASATYTFTTPLTPETNGVNWIAPGEIYSWQGNVVEYDRDRTYYAASRDSETGELSMWCGVNFDPAYDPTYRVVGKSEEDFLGRDHSFPTYGVERDGLLYLYDECDAALNENRTIALGFDYSGQVFTSEVVADAATYDILKLSILMDGQVTWSVDVAYDEPEPQASMVLRAAFERQSDHMVTLTYVVDPGTDHELSKVLTVPANSQASFLTGDQPYVLFNDPDNTTLTDWDGLTDISWYIYTDPSDELMDQYARVYSAYLMESDVETFSSQIMTEVVQANTREALLANHTGVFYTVTWPLDEGGNYACYLEDGFYYETCDAYSFLADEQGEWYEEYEDGKTLSKYAFFAMSDEERDARRTYYFEACPVDTENTLLEQVVDIRPNDDGTLSLTTQQEAGAYDDLVPEEYHGLPVEFSYILDGETAEIRVMKDQLVRGEERIDACITEVTADAARPEGMERLLALRAAHEDLDPADAWTATVVYDAGTEAEQRYSVQLRLDVEVYFVFRDGYEEVSRERPEGTKDLVLYAGPVQP